ncbi:hypothetical protein ABZ990_07735 [Streptomyces sp. NPDC046203]|uniref:hypothetical protein n=1 Tax=Streptomyces sp. NPDC046203 TaxID=3154602 RepID=UPI0033CB60D9
MQHIALRRIAGTVVALAALGAGALVTAGSASAATGKNGVLESGEMGFFCSSDSVFDLYTSDSNFGDDQFVAGTCKGKPVQGNITSLWNRDSATWWVYTGADAGGIEGGIPAGYSGNTSSTFKNAISSAYYYKAR